MAKEILHTSRDFTRSEAPGDTVITVKKLGETARTPVKKVIDFGGGGLRVVVDTKLNIDEDVDFKVELPRRAVKFIGNVRNCEKCPDGYTTGIEFITISETNLEYLLKLFQSETPKKA